MEKRITRSGGITIPAALRRDAGIEGREKIDIKIQGNGDILIKRITGQCIFCGADEKISAYKGRFVCNDCRNEIGGRA